jgi:predicted Zn-dependent protease
MGRKQLLLLPESQVDQMGVAAFTQMKQKQPAESGTASNLYVACVANAITSVVGSGQHWDVALFKSDQVNAFALPGGKIGVYTGLLKVARTQDQLAAVLGHEVGHVLAHHGNERMSLQFASDTGMQLLTVLSDGKSNQQQMMLGLLGVGLQYGVALPFSRTQESEADLIGLQLMAKAGFDPRQAVALWQNMAAAGGAQPPEFMSTHPSDAHRIRNLEAHLPQAEGLYRQSRAAGHVPQCGSPG